MRLVLLFILGLASASLFHYDGDILGYPVELDADITQHRVDLNFTMDVLTMECSFERTFSQFPCYKAVKFDLKKERCMHEIGKHISALEVNFNNDELKISAKYGVWISKTAHVSEHQKSEICRPARV